MEFLVSQCVHKQIRMLKKQSLEEESSDTDYEDPVKRKDDEILDLSRKKSLLAMHLVYFLTQLSVQVVLLVILTHYHMPLIKKPIWCSTHLCHGPYTCVIMGTQEKMMSFVILATFSVVIVVFCAMFFLYTADVYLVTGKNLV